MKYDSKAILLCSALFVAAMLPFQNPAVAAELVIGSRWEPVMDPHFAWSGANLQFYRQYHGYVAEIGPNDEATPGIATFTSTSDTVWELKVVPGAKFDNGKPISAEDIISSFKRARDLPNALGTYKGLFSGITSMTAVDDKTVRIVSDAPYPTFPNALTQISILPKEVAETAVQEDFDSAKGNVGAGPYSFDSFVRGEKLTLKRNPTYFGRKAVWDKVTFKFLKTGSTRVAGLLAGELDLIDGVPPNDAKKISADSRFSVFSGASDRTVYLGFDMVNDVSESVTDDSGKPISPNPLKDIRVRKALALAVNREGIKDRVMDGYAYPANQLIPPSIGGYSKNISQPKYDPDGAKKLLAEAGFKSGFNIVLLCPSDRLVNGSQVCEALGQMFTRIGVKTKVDSIPYAVYAARVRTDKRGAVYMASWGASSSGESDVLRNVFHSLNKELGLGTWNLNGYSTPELDKLLEQSLYIIDRDKRRAVLARAMELVISDVAAIPLHTQAVVIAARKSLKFTTYADESTFANAATPAN